MHIDLRSWVRQNASSNTKVEIRGATRTVSGGSNVSPLAPVINSSRQVFLNNADLLLKPT